MSSVQELPILPPSLPSCPPTLPCPLLSHPPSASPLQSYSESLELFDGARSLLTAKATSVSAKVRQQLEDYLQEELLVLQLLSANRDLVARGRALLQHRYCPKEVFYSISTHFVAMQCKHICKQRKESKAGIKVALVLSHYLS